MDLRAYVTSVSSIATNFDFCKAVKAVDFTWPLHIVGSVGGRTGARNAFMHGSDPKYEDETHDTEVMDLGRTKAPRVKQDDDMPESATYVPYYQEKPIDLSYFCSDSPVLDPDYAEENANTIEAMLRYLGQIGDRNPTNAP
jgi:hypothetical protein